MTLPRVIIVTEFGDIVLELYQEEAPITVSNFLQYIDENRFSSSVFYRVVHLNNQPNNHVKIEVVQGGLKDDHHPDCLPAIRHETTVQTGILHRDGVISMARKEPGTASSEFFICIGDQPELNFGGKRNPDGQGFAAFGRVIEGMAVVRQIQNQPDQEQYLSADIRILEIKRT